MLGRSISEMADISFRMTFPSSRTSHAVQGYGQSRYQVL